MSLTIKGGITVVPVRFVGDLQNKQAVLSCMITHTTTGKPLGQIDVSIVSEKQPESDTQEPTMSWDEFMASNEEGPLFQQALMNLANKMAPLSKAIEFKAEEA